MKKTIIWILGIIILSSFVHAAQNCTSLNDAIAGYTFDDGENLVDISGNNHNLTNDGTENISGKIGEARHFVVGNTDLLQIGTPEFIADYTNYSIICWFNSTNDNPGAIYSEANSVGDNDFMRILVQSSGDGGDVYFEHLSATGTDIIINGGQVVNDGTYHHLVVTRAGSLFNLFIDGLLDATGSATVGTITQNRAAFGVLWRQNPLGYFDGNIDECYIYNRTITDQEINDSYNSDAGCQPYKVGVLPQIDLLFANDTDTTTYKTVFDEGEEIFGYINWTLDNGTIIDNSSGSCNMTFVEGILEDKSSNTNFTICNSGCDFDSFTDEFSFHSGNLTDPVVEDTVRFDACHLSSPTRDIDVSISCGTTTNSFVVDKSSFPLCSTGTGTVVVDFTDCINNLTINATVDNSAVNIGQGHRIVNFELDREYMEHLNNGTDIIFNTTLNLFQINHTHEYYKHGSKEIFANCTHNTDGNFSEDTSENITIVNAPPQIFIERITTSLGSTALLDGVDIEFANGTWEWFIVVVDDDLDFINYSWFNTSGILLFNLTSNGTPETVNTSSGLFVEFDGNPFNLTVFANDTFANSTTSSIIFNATDTIGPSCNFDSRIFVDMGTNVTFNVTCTDENFFSLNVTCPINNQSFNISGLNVEEYLFNQTFFLNATDTCSFRYCDGHTSKFLDDVWFTSQKDNKQEVFRDFTKVSELWVEDGEIEFEQGHDRLKFKIKFGDTGKPYQSVFYNVSPRSSHLFDSKYAGWIADPVSETWFDLNNKLRSLVMTIDRDNGLWEFRIYTNEEEIEFESIGELNCVSGSFSVVAAFEYTLEPGVCPTTIAGVLTMWMVLGLALFLMSVGWVWRIREPGFFGSLLLITFSWTVVACHLWAGYVCAGIGMYFLFWFILKK